MPTDCCRRRPGAEFLGLDSGFTHLNRVCNGLDTGLTVLAAPPGHGKTTFAWQLGCQVAERCGVPVVFVSLEQAKAELRAKALARFARLDTRHVLRGRLRSDDPQHVAALRTALERYLVVSQHLTIVEGDDRTDLDAIRDVARERMRHSGAARCLVIIDYLQILPLRDADRGRAPSAKDKVDLLVSGLRRLARDLGSPVVAISSQNRAGYDQKTLDVFKESGGIEYSADVAMVLTRDKTAEPAHDHRKLKLVVLKNRNGETGSISFQFYPGRAEFVETGFEAATIEDDA